MVRYGFILTTADALDEELTVMNKYQDKIVAVTQNGNFYTIFYEDGGNAKDGADNG